MEDLSIRDSVQIHSLATVDPSAELEEGVVIGPGAYVGPNVSIGSYTVIGPNVVLEGSLKIGSSNKVFPGACLGLEPQDLKYKGALTEVIIGNNNTIRESVTINRATEEGEQTILGDGNLLMAYCHLGHNCEVGNGVVMSNSVQVAGHVVIDDSAVIGGCIGIHQFVHIGKLAMIGGMTRVDRDVPPYCLVEGNPPRLRGLNRVGLKRKGYDSGEREFRDLLDVWNLLYRSGNVLEEALLLARENELTELALQLCTFLESSIQKGRRGPMPAKYLKD